MKKLVFMFVAVAAISFASCGNQAQAPVQDTDSIAEVRPQTKSAVFFFFVRRRPIPQPPARNTQLPALPPKAEPAGLGSGAKVQSPATLLWGLTPASTNNSPIMQVKRQKTLKPLGDSN